METIITAQAALLQALIRGPGYGLDLIDRVREQTDGRVDLKNGSVYPALRTLEREGFVTSYEADASRERGGRPRRYYKLTAEGRRAAAETRATVGALFGFALPEGA
ncbi:MAG TPA: PadR family transcriptional regulator [Myxococcales bacterium]|jgi:PadR family transcriptional regulator PadR